MFQRDSAIVRLIGADPVWLRPGAVINIRERVTIGDREIETELTISNVEGATLPDDLLQRQS